MASPKKKKSPSSSGSEMGTPTRRRSPRNHASSSSRDLKEPPARTPTGKGNVALGRTSSGSKRKRKGSSSSKRPRSAARHVRFTLDEDEAESSKRIKTAETSEEAVLARARGRRDAWKAAERDENSDDDEAVGAKQDAFGFEEFDGDDYFGTVIVERTVPPRPSPALSTPRIDTDLLSSPESAAADPRKINFREEDEVLSGPDDDGLDYSSADSSVKSSEEKAKEDSSDSESDSDSDSDSESDSASASESESEPEKEKEEEEEEEEEEEVDAGKRIVQRTQKIAKVISEAPRVLPVTSFGDDDDDDDDSSSDEYDSDEESDTDIDGEQFYDEWAGSESDSDREIVTVADIEGEVNDESVLSMVEQTPQATAASMSMSGGKIIDPMRKPARTPGLRRSKRTRWEPLKYWKGERLRVEKVSAATEEAIRIARQKRRYSVGVGALLHGELTNVKTKVMAVQDEHFKTPGKRKYTGKRRGRRPGQKNQPKEDEENEDANALPPIVPKDFVDSDVYDLIKCFDRLEGKHVEKDCVRMQSDITYSYLPRGNGEEYNSDDEDPKDLVEGTVDKYWGLAQAGASFDDTRFVSGIVHLKPLSLKPFEGTHACTQVFHITEAQRKSVDVCIEGAEGARHYLLSAGDHFWVPHDCMYSINNRSQNIPARIHFVLLKPAMGNEDVSNVPESPLPSLSPKKRLINTK